VGTDGEETEQFIIDAELLGWKPIVELLHQAAQEYGYTHRGAAAHCCFVATLHQHLNEGEGQGCVAELLTDNV
jgi:SAUR family protein